MGKLRNILIYNILVLLIASCNSPLENEENDGGYNLDLPIFPNSYSEPSVSPDGEQILFRRVKITNFNSGGGYNIDYDSTGIWIANSDGSDMRLLLKYGKRPSLSPDGHWLLFGSGGHIFKVPMDSNSVDTTSIIQLTNSGRNFHPTWSPDGEWIAYGRSVCEGENTCGVWIISSDGTETYFIDSYGMYPTWHPGKLNIIYIKRAVTTYGQVLGDSLLIFKTETNEKKILALLHGENLTNRYPKYSPDGTLIIFMSQTENKVPQIWVMNSDGSDPQKLTDYGGQDPTWTPDGKIIYVHYNYYKYHDSNNGTLWIMNADGSNKQQITFNHGLQLVEQRR